MARSTLYPSSVKPGIPKLGSKPRGWTETTFGDVLQVVQRPAEIKDEVEYQLVTAKRARGGIVPREILLGKKILTKIQYYIAKDDFLISKRQIVHGACGIVPSSLNGAIVSGEYSVLRVDNGILLKYLDYFSHTDYFQMSCFQSSVGVDIEKMIFDLKEWLKYRIYLPPFREQEKIVKILATWDESISKTRRIITLLHERKKEIMKRVLTGQTRFLGFNQEWQEYKLKDVANLINGRAFKPEDWKTQGIPIIRIQNLNGSSDFNYYDQLVEEKHYVSENDLLFAWSGSRGTSFGPFIWKGSKAILNQHIFKVETDDSIVEKQYLYFFLKQITSKIEQRAHGGAGLVHITKSELEKFLVDIPLSKSERLQISGMLSLSEKEIEIYERYLASLLVQKKGLMQKLLTGQIRVKV